MMTRDGDDGDDDDGGGGALVYRQMQKCLRGAV
jgi:hypothetical protein